MPRHLKIVIIFGGIYSIAMQMAILLVPLYALQLGLPPLSLAFIVSVPAVLQIAIRAIGGAINNYLGENRILKISFLAISLAGMLFIFSDTVASIYLAQFVLSVSRGLFWSTAQTYLSRQPEAEGRLSRIFGYFEVTTAIGGIAGLLIGGYFSQWFGLSWAFSLLVMVGLISFLMCRFLPESPRNRTKRISPSGFRNFGAVVRHRPLYLAGLCAFTAALPLSLAGSFYPVHFKELGMEDGMIGAIVSMMALGSITAGLFVARVLDRVRVLFPYVVSLMLIGFTLITIQFLSSPLALGLLIVITGLGSGTSSILYQSLTAKFSTSENRGPAMAFTTNFWSLSHLIIPVLFGALTEKISLPASFVVAGVGIIIIGSTALLGRRWFRADL